MPCDSVVQTTVVWNEQSTSLDIFRKAAASLGWQWMHGWVFKNNLSQTFELSQGEIVATMQRGATFDVNALKRAYTREVISYAKSQYGWSMEEQSPVKGKIERRY